MLTYLLIGVIVWAGMQIYNWIIDQTVARYMKECVSDVMYIMKRKDVSLITKVMIWALPILIVIPLFIVLWPIILVANIITTILMHKEEKIETGF